MITQVLLAIACYAVLWFLIACFKKDNGIVDIAWGLGFVLIFFVSGGIHSPETKILAAMVILWALRLAGHILLRNRGKPEDYRYANWRKLWMEKGVVYFYVRSFLQVFALQGSLMIIISAPILVVQWSTDITITLWHVLGFFLWAIGFLFETIGDYQLAQFVKIKKPKEVMTKGLWKYTRHPNYFGEVLLWWGIGIFAASDSLLALIGPAVISFFILKVSGIPMLEEKYMKYPKFRAYAKKTNAFFPWFPKD